MTEVKKITYAAKMITKLAMLSTVFLGGVSAAPFTVDVLDGDNTGAVDLGFAGSYAILSKSGISSVPQSAITGDIGVSPIAATAITGFTLTADSTNAFSSSTQVTGRVLAADYAVPTPALLTSAVGAMEAAYTDAAGRDVDVTRINILTGAIDEITMRPGVYQWDGDVSFSKPVTFQGDSDDIFILQIAGNLLVGGGARVILLDGARAENIFWQVAGSAEIGLSVHMEGIILIKTAITFITGSSLNGRVLSQTATVLQSATIVAPA
jgi:hypothetical protein